MADAAKDVAKVAAQWAAQEVKYLYGVRDKVEELKNELMWMQCFLSDAHAKQQTDALTRKWVSQIKDLSYEAEDIIEKFNFKVCYKERHKGGLCSWSTLKWFSCLLNDGLALHEVGSDADALREKISKLTSRMQTYGVKSMQMITTNLKKVERSRSKLEDATAIGIEDDIESLAEQLVNDGRKVVLVHGMGGLGKTTLATKVYHHHSVRKHFEGFAWVDVSQQLQGRKIVVMKGMLRQLAEKDGDHDQLLPAGEKNKPPEMYETGGQLSPSDDQYVRAWEIEQRRIESQHEIEQRRNEIEQRRESRRREIEQLGYQQLPGELCKTLKENKYLVVLDDIWTTEDYWDLLQEAFPLVDNETTASKILITTRNRGLLPENLRKSVLYHEPKLLDDNKSWELSKIKAFGETSELTDAGLEDLGKKMLERCEGLPLAIVELGGVLATTKSTKEEWQKVHNSINFYLGRQNTVHSISSRSHKGSGSVHDVLAKSYYDLPSDHLKQCFLYLGSFPEDYNIPAEKLYHMWMAEGLVTPPSAITWEADAAESYLNELVQKHLVQAVEKNSEGKVQSCRLHKLMRDVCLQIAEEDNFLRVVGRRSDDDDDDEELHPSVSLGTTTTRSMLQSDRLRRLAIYVSRDIKRSLADFSSGKAQNLRSLLLFPAEQCKEADFEGLIMQVCNEFRLLRVLDLEGFHHVKGIKLPRQVGKLIYLRFLSLKGTRVKELPSSIGNLIYLETLDLRVADVILMVPNLLWKLARLRHLYLPSRRLSLEAHVSDQGYEIRKGEELRLNYASPLEILEDIDLDRFDPWGLICLTWRRNMRRLSASCFSKQENLEPFLQSKSVESLSLKIDGGIVSKEPMILSTCQSLRNLDIKSGISVPLRLEMFPESLVKLGFWYCNLKQDPMPILEKLPQLRSLGLHFCYHGWNLVCSAGGFPELTSLRIDGLSRLEEWTVEPGALSKLKKLEINNSPIKILPDALPSSVNIACIPGIAKNRRMVE
ncbi:hypothetical protein Dimus_002611 [Dionaea muscipula]